LYGWPVEEIVGRLTTDFFGVAIGDDTASEIMRALAAGASWEGTFDVRRKDGTPLSVHAVDSPLYDTAGHLQGLVSLLIDATRVRTEQFLAKCAVVLGASLDFQRNLL